MATIKKKLSRALTQSKEVDLMINVIDAGESKEEHQTTSSYLDYQKITGASYQ